MKTMIMGAFKNADGHLICKCCKRDLSLPGAMAMLNKEESMGIVKESYECSLCSGIISIMRNSDAKV